MPVTLTIKGVPDAVAEALRQRAQAGRRSLQRELLLIAEEAAGQRRERVAEPVPPVYATGTATVPKRRTAAKKPAGGRLSLEQLWQRARRLGEGQPSESAAIVRGDRDARDRR
jgi:hypothetical protein